MVPNEYEIKILKMMNGDIPWESGSWVNACFEFLQEMGLSTRAGTITEKGKKFLDGIK